MNDSMIDDRVCVCVHVHVCNLVNYDCVCVCVCVFGKCDTQRSQEQNDVQVCL